MICEGVNFAIARGSNDHGARKADCITADNAERLDLSKSSAEPFKSFNFRMPNGRFERFFQYFISFYQETR